MITPTYYYRADKLEARTGIGDTFTVAAGMLWRANLPAQVQVMLVRPGAGTRMWILDRHTLAAGLDRPTGLGDFSVMPDLSRDDTSYAVELVLAGCGVGRNLSVGLVADPLRKFLDRTYAVSAAAWTGGAA